MRPDIYVRSIHELHPNKTHRFDQCAYHKRPMSYMKLVSQNGNGSVAMDAGGENGA